jgi:hypothetical protein
MPCSSEAWRRAPVSRAMQRAESHSSCSGTGRRRIYEGGVPLQVKVVARKEMLTAESKLGEDLGLEPGEDRLLMERICKTVEDVVTAPPKGVRELKKMGHQ